MDNHRATLIVFLLFLLALIVGYIIATLAGEIAYKAGQIDALTGNVKYHLVVKPDSTRVWEKIDD